MSYRSTYSRNRRQLFDLTRPGERVIGASERERSAGHGGRHVTHGAMRARPPPPLLLATLAIVTTAAPLLLSDPTTAPLLLVVHSGCPTQDPSLYSKSRLEQYATATKQLSKLSRPYRLLSYEGRLIFDQNT